jgi:hypothetical protein
MMTTLLRQAVPMRHLTTTPKSSIYSIGKGRSDIAAAFFVCGIGIYCLNRAALPPLRFTQRHSTR